jgi:glycosyltransferase involved in cell wall biosynthesis
MTSLSFSVVTAVRNGMPQLRRCVGSVRGQDGVSVEHVVQDGLSMDGTGEWLASQTDLAVTSESDRGMYDAINRAWRRSHGDVLSWLNADEQYLPGTLAAVQETFQSRPELDIVFGDALIVDPSGALIAARREVPLRRAYVAGSFLYALSCATFFRRSLLDRGDLVFNADRRIAGDAELLLSLLAKGYRAGHLRRYLALFTIDGSNLSLSPDAQRECVEVRGRGAGRVPSLLASSARRAEKAVRGCYARRPVSYVWAADERPTYREFSYDRAPTRFEWSSPAAPMRRS